ncbi:hypothetical protein HYW46_00410 [Candidatus Daviesbacteria bacterium]|nr:hypothetical protein [Candidatus Daviesbacteria bacterium]
MREQEFFTELFERAIKWREEDGDKVVAEFWRQKTSPWSLQEFWRLFKLDWGMVLRNNRYDSAFALGTESVPSPKRDNETWVFHFGIWKKFPRGEIYPNTYARYFNKLYRGSGKFYIEPALKRPKLDCFADLGEWGGREYRIGL